MIYEYDNLFNFTYLYCQGGCRTGMAKVTNAYDLPARCVYWHLYFAFSMSKLIVSIYHMARSIPLCNHNLPFAFFLGEKKLRMSLSQCCCIDAKVHSHAIFDPF